MVIHTLYHYLQMVGTLVLQFINSYTKYLAYFSRVLMTKILAVTRYVLFLSCTLRKYSAFLA